MKCDCDIQEFDMEIRREWTGRILVEVWCPACSILHEKIPIRIITDEGLILLKERSVFLGIGAPFKKEFLLEELK